MAKRIAELVNERRNETTTRFAVGRPRWLSLNRDQEGLALWNSWVLDAPNSDEMFRRAKIALEDEAGRAALQDGQAE